MLRTLLGALVAAVAATAGLTLATPPRAFAAIATAWNASAESAHRSCAHRPWCGDRRRPLGIDFVKPPIDEAGKSAEFRRNRAEFLAGPSRKPRHLTMGEYTIGTFRWGKGLQESILQKSHRFGPLR